MPDQTAPRNPERANKIRELKILRELHIRRALKDPLYWLMKATKTFDEQDMQNPYKPFPDREYISHMFDVFDHEPISFLEKSRTMMASWTVSAWAAHNGFSRPFTTVFQSEDEDRAVHCVENIKCLWEHSEPELKERWPLARPLDKQPYNYLEMANGSWFLGIPGNPDKVRSAHPTCYVADEAAFMSYFSEAYGNAVATRAPHIIALSSANPGEFYEFVKNAKPVDWPSYPQREAVHA